VDAIREDKSRVNLLKISELGLIEMTRKRTRESLTQQLCEPCPNCEGNGYVQSSRTVSNKIFRELKKAVGFLSGDTLLVHTHPAVAELLLGEEAETLKDLEEKLGRTLAIRPDAKFHQEQFEITAAT
jgi:ribonuclease G